MIKIVWLFLITTVIIFSIILSYISINISQLKGGGYDADRFYEHAASWFNNEGLRVAFDSEAFIQLVALYRMVGLDQYFSVLISIFLLTYTLTKYIARLKVSFVTIVIIYFCVISPSAILRMSVLLREPYFIFFITLSLSILIPYLYKSLDLNFFIGLLLFVIGAIFHKAAIILFPITILVFYSVKYINNYRGILKFTIISLFIIIILYFIINNLPYSRGTQVLISIFSGDTEVISQLSEQKASRDFRSTYDFGADYSSLMGICKTIFFANFYYYFKPFIYEVRDIPTLYLSVENMLRIYILVILVKYSIKSKNKSAIFILLVYFAFNSIWALGTSNYGTGSRHHWSSIFLLLPILKYYDDFYFKRTKNVSNV